MRFCIGRNNLALTVFVPWDCSNNCPFCTSKESYSRKVPSFQNVAYQLKRIMDFSSYPIRDVVFSGGEPMENVEKLKELIDLVPDNRDVYINTSFIRKNMDDFITLVNNTEKIKGVNISRHFDTFLADDAFLCNIAPDYCIDKIQKPVRINCVLDDVGKIDKIIERWSDYIGVEVSFRKDYTSPLTEKELHNPYDPVPMALINMGFKFLSHTQCNVCDTSRFINKDGFVAQYHKGLKNSSIREGGDLEFNDLIIEQDGFFTYDWGVNDPETMFELAKCFEFIPSLRSAATGYFTVPYGSCECAKDGKSTSYGLRSSSGRGCGGGC